MVNLKRYKPNNLAVARKTGGNPEGKGLNGFLLDWYQTAPRRAVAKPGRQILAELFTSMLVLSAQFKYRPAVRAANYLYWINGAWSISLISPEEWSDERRAGFAGTCVLQDDMTWTISPSDLLAGDNAVSDAMGRFYEAFAETLDTDLSLEEILPYYVARLPYYQRLHASALSRSLHTTVALGEQTAISCRQWQMLLPRLQNVLQAHGV